MAFEPNISIVGRIGSGFLAVMPKPVTGEWAEDEFANISRFGIRQVVSLLETDEAEVFDLHDEAALCEKNGMRFIHYPICDRSLPESLDDFVEFTHQIFRDVESGVSTVVHCLAGIGRSGITACGVLIHSGMTAEAAFDQITEARGLQVPDTEQQRDWIATHQRAFTPRSTEQAADRKPDNVAS